MKTPTRRSVFGSTPLGQESTHATESCSYSRHSRPSNPFSKGADLEYEQFRRVSLVPSTLGSFITPQFRHKRSLYSDLDSQCSLNMPKKLKSQHSTPLMNYSIYSDASVISNDATWKQRSAVLCKLSENQQKADEIMSGIPSVLREVDKCNNLIKDLRIAPS